MKCKICHDDYGQEFDDDFVNGECLPCRSQIEFDAYCVAEAKEINRYNKKYSTNYDDNSFFYACDAEKIDISTLKGFPKMRDIKNYSDRIKAEIDYNDRLYEKGNLIYLNYFSHPL